MKEIAIRFLNGRPLKIFSKQKSKSKQLFQKKIDENCSKNLGKDEKVLYVDKLDQAASSCVQITFQLNNFGWNVVKELLENIGNLMKPCCLRCFQSYTRPKCTFLGLSPSRVFRFKKRFSSLMCPRFDFFQQYGNNENYTISIPELIWIGPLFVHYALLSYVLSTSFSTHPKPLTWDKKPFQSRRAPLYTFFDAMRLSPFFRQWDCSNFFFFSNFFIAPPIKFLMFCNRMDIQKFPKGPPFTFFGTMRLTGGFKKIQKNIRKNFFLNFQFFENFCCLQL